MGEQRSEFVPRTEDGNCHTEPCRSLRCPCFISGEHDPTGADHMEEMWVHAQRADAAEAENEQLRATLADVLSRFTEKGHPGLPCLRTGWQHVGQVEAWRASLSGRTIDDYPDAEGLAVLREQTPDSGSSKADL